MEIKHRDVTPPVHPVACLAPTAVASPIRAGLEEAGGFLPFVFGTDPATGRDEQMRTAMRRYTTMLARAHRDDE
jgi:hypothetical protein